jgi:hypothetical protein
MVVGSFCGSLIVALSLLPLTSIAVLIPESKVKKSKEYVLFPGLCAPTAISVPQCLARCRQKGSAVLWNEARSRGAFQHSDVQHLEMGAVRYKLRQV